MIDVPDCAELRVGDAGLGLELVTGAALGSIAGSTGRVSIEDESGSVGFFHILVISGSYRRGPYL